MIKVMLDYHQYNGHDHSNNFGECSILSPGFDTLSSMSQLMLPSKVERPISSLTVAATSNKQNVSFLHNSLACSFNPTLANVGSKTGEKVGE